MSDSKKTLIQGYSIFFHGIVGGIYERIMGLSVGNEGRYVGSVGIGHEQEKYKSQVY